MRVFLAAASLDARWSEPLREQPPWQPRHPVFAFYPELESQLRVAAIRAQAPESQRRTAGGRHRDGLSVTVRPVGVSVARELDHDPSSG